MKEKLMQGRPRVTPQPKEQPRVFPVFGGRYQSQVRLHEGIAAEVYGATDVVSGNKVAVKVLSDITSNPEVLAYFLQEIKILELMQDHQGIVDILDKGITPERLRFFVMKFLEGKDLEKVIEGGQLPLLRALNIAIQVCNILDTAHAKGIIHRDIKPTNIFLTDDPPDTVKILDFGIARVDSNPIPEKEGTFLGTPHYTAPEVIQGLAHDHRSDIYATGIVLYEMLCGVPTFDCLGGSAQQRAGQIILMHINKLPKRPRSIREDIPRAIEDVIMCALSKDPNRRFQSMVEMQAAIESYLHPQTHTVETAQPEIHPVKQLIDNVMAAFRAARSHLF